MSERPTRQLVILVVLLGSINFLVAAFFELFRQSYQLSQFLVIILILLQALVAALMMAFIIVTAAPIFKDFLVTYRRLLRLENLSHPLLIRLSKEAAGTYHHSLTLANMSHQAAKAIGADALLARVGAYYHDIGKLKNPSVYVENQKKGENGENKVTQISPRQSAQEIISHVKEGIKLAKENNFPKEVIDFIPEHHGTTLVSFFYNQLKSQGKKVFKKDFRYPGPKPLSKETAILMVADSVEAISRTKEKLTERTIKQIINDVLNQRLDEGQLELSGLTATNIRKVSKSFVDSLITIYHDRIEYPPEKKT